MVKKSLFHALLLTSILAVLSTAHAMKNNTNIEENEKSLKVTAKQLKKGLKKGSIDIEGIQYAVESLSTSKPQFDLIPLCKGFSSFKTRENKVFFQYKKNDTEVFNVCLTQKKESNENNLLNLGNILKNKFSMWTSDLKNTLAPQSQPSNISSSAFSFIPDESIKTFFNQTIAVEQPSTFVVYKNENGTVTFSQFEEIKKKNEKIKIIEVSLDKEKIATIPLDKDFSLIAKMSEKPMPFYLHKEGEYIRTLRNIDGEPTMLPISTPVPINKEILKNVRHLNCFLY